VPHPGYNKVTVAELRDVVRWIWWGVISCHSDTSHRAQWPAASTALQYCAEVLSKSHEKCVNLGQYFLYPLQQSVAVVFVVTIFTKLTFTSRNCAKACCSPLRSVEHAVMTLCQVWLLEPILIKLILVEQLLTKNSCNELDDNLSSSWTAHTTSQAEGNSLHVQWYFLLRKGPPKLPVNFMLFVYLKMIHWARNMYV